MNFRTIYTTTTFLAATLFSCSEESPFLSEQEAKSKIKEMTLERDPFHLVEDVVATINNDIYYFELLDSTPERLTFTPQQSKTHVKLSADKTQIAYINSNGNPVIIARDGKPVTTLTQYNYIKQMDWTKTGNTLYFLIDQKVYFYGDPVTIKQPVITHPWDEVPSYSMNAKGDYGYFIKRYGSYSTTLAHHTEKENKNQEFPNFEGKLFDYIDFYDNNGNFLLGYADYYGEGFSRIACVQDYNFWSVYEWDDDNMYTPEFNGDLEILLYGTMENQVHQVKAVYLGTEAYNGSGLYDVLSKTLTNYPSNSPVYLDWSH
jgi:hypothetical protein